MKEFGGIGKQTQHLKNPAQMLTTTFVDVQWQKKKKNLPRNINMRELNQVEKGKVQRT